MMPPKETLPPLTPLSSGLCLPAPDEINTLIQLLFTYTEADITSIAIHAHTNTK